ncbi:MAG: hypothetical protein M3P27_01540 [Acidobacteriota bacterium]|nr:hypothetical protein [Acidobacteriota bacterium]
MHSFDLGRFYVWFLFVVSIITALARLGLPGQFAEVMAAKLSDERKRRRQRIWGWAILAGSPLILLYGLFGHVAPWMWVAAGIGILNGLEQLLNTAYADRASLTYLSRIFGSLHALAAIAIWMLVLRHPAVQ